MQSILKLWASLTKKRQKQFWLLLVLMLIAGFSEIISLGALLPFLGVLTDPNYVFTHSYAQPIVKMLGINEPNQLILPLTFIFITAVLLSSMIRLSLLYVMTRFSYSTGADISIDIYIRTLYQPYSTHISRNSSEIINGIINKTNTVSNGIIQPILFLISSLVIMTSILSALFVIDVLAASISSVGFGSLYWLIIRNTRKRLDFNSELIANESTKVIQSLQEGLGGIRDVLLDGNQKFYSEMYKNSDLPLRRAQGENSFITGSPRFIMEALGMILIVVLAYILSQRNEGIISAIPILGALALGAQRLLPALQQAYGSISTIRGAQSSFQDILKLLEQKIPVDTNKEVVPIAFEKNIVLDNISFCYEEGTPWIVKNINLNISKGQQIGFFGETGSGKSTLFDIIMGLLFPTEGLIKVDGQPINISNLRSWQANIAHVPQSIYLSDASIAENIAFGCAKDSINYELVKFAAKKAQITTLINEMPEQYQTQVGERGVRLSGGQRQRIGIARALYKKAKVIILDEATSALDSDTESEVMKSVDALHEDLTILIIAHRLTTLKNCDQIIELGNTGIISSGSYNELILNQK